MGTGLERKSKIGGPLAPHSPPDSTPGTSLDFDQDGHGPFRNMCFVYGDINRPVFLQEIIHWFVRSASKNELAALRCKDRNR